MRNPIIRPAALLLAIVPTLVSAGQLQSKLDAFEVAVREYQRFGMA